MAEKTKRSVYTPLHGKGRRRDQVKVTGSKGVKARPQGLGKRNCSVISYSKGGDNDSSFLSDDHNKPLSVLHCDLEVKENSHAHHTDEYFLCQSEVKGQPGQLVVRRGQSFNITIQLNREFRLRTDDLRIVFEAGDEPSVAKGTEVDMVLSDKDEPNQWGAKILKQLDTSLTVTVFTPPSCIVAKWNLSVHTFKRDDTDAIIYRYEHDDPIYIIFNPWCKDDSVYLDDEEMIQEYVMNETGRLYGGSKEQITYFPWVFGQFESPVLDVALHLISELPITIRGNPIPVVRKLSKTVNSDDDDGVLEGKWGGDFRDGRTPQSWTGSVAILEQFWENGRPVKYGQCWVFSGLCTSLARSLGIPVRSVTNFASAHDRDGSMTIDIRCDMHGKVDDDLSDSIWNFHVWNEAWMTRPDLPTGYGGWQAFDATSQETSDGVYCCGPVSVAAVRQGAVNLPFDAPFVFAEVNGDKFWWRPDDHGNDKCFHVNKSVVGKFISTKMPNSDQREDITHQYKPAEGSAKERAHVLNANLSLTTMKLYERTTEDVKFEVIQDAANSWVGEDFKVSLRMTNTSFKPRTVQGKMMVKTMYYTGMIADKLDEFYVDQTLGANCCDTVPGTVCAKDYVDLLKDCCMLDVSVWMKVIETNQIFVNKDDFRLRKPHLVIKGASEVVKGEEFEVEVSFTNPLDVSLTECVVTVDGLTRSLRFPQKNVSAKGTFLATLPITPIKVGHKQLVVVFSSKQLDGINGSKDIFARGNLV